MMEPHPEKSPVSYSINVRNLPAKGITATFTADPEQRRQLAEAHGLLSVEGFSTELLVRPWKKDGIQVSGRVKAEITQACVVTLEPLTARIDEDVSAILVPENSRLARIEGENAEIILQAEGDDLPEIFSGDSVDVGALAEEFFELAIDPYPRKEGSELDRSAEGGEETGGGPLYEALRKLKGNG